MLELQRSDLCMCVCVCVRVRVCVYVCVRVRVRVCQSRLSRHAQRGEEAQLEVSGVERKFEQSLEAEGAAVIVTSSSPRACSAADVFAARAQSQPRIGTPDEFNLPLTEQGLAEERERQRGRGGEGEALSEELARPTEASGSRPSDFLLRAAQNAESDEVSDAVMPAYVAQLLPRPLEPEATAANWQPFRSRRGSAASCSPSASSASIPGSQDKCRADAVDADESPCVTGQASAFPSDHTVQFWADDKHFARTPRASEDEACRADILASPAGGRTTMAHYHRAQEHEADTRGPGGGEHKCAVTLVPVEEDTEESPGCEKENEATLVSRAAVFAACAVEQKNQAEKQQAKWRLMAARRLVALCARIFSQWIERSQSAARVVRQMASLRHVNPMLAMLSVKDLRQLEQESQCLQMKDGDQILLHTTAAEEAGSRKHGAARGGRDVLCLLLRGLADVSFGKDAASKPRAGRLRTTAASGDEADGGARASSQQRLSIGHTCGGVSLLLAPDLLGLMCCASTCLRWHADARALRALRQRHPSVAMNESALSDAQDCEGVAGVCTEVLLVGRAPFDELIAPILQQHVARLTATVCSSLPMLSQLPSEHIRDCLDAAQMVEWDALSGQDALTHGSKGELIIAEGAQDGLGLHILVLGSVDLASRDDLTSQFVRLSRLNNAGDVMGTASAERAPYSAYAGEHGATTLFFPQEVAQIMLRLAGKAAAHRCMEDFCLSRLAAVRTGHAKKSGEREIVLCVASAAATAAVITLLVLFARAAAVNRIKTRLEALQSQIALVLALDHQLMQADMRLTERDVSFLLGPWVRLHSVLDTGMSVRRQCCSSCCPLHARLRARRNKRSRMQHTSFEGVLKF